MSIKPLICHFLQRFLSWFLKVKLTDSIDGKTNITFYQNQFSNHPANKLVVLEGHHYLHWTRYKEMSQYVNDFTETFVAD